MDMDQPSSQADHLTVWQFRLRAMEENAADIPHLETRRIKLQDILNRAHIAVRDQAAAAAEKQDASRRLEALIAEGRMAMTFLNACLREHYGKDSEKLAEFKLMPYRGRRPKVEEPPAPTPEDAQ
jgi:hypothetical protein